MNRLKTRSAGVRYASGSLNHQPRTASLLRIVRFTCQALLIFLLFGTAARAECYWINGAGPQNFTYSIPQITIPRNATVGTVIYDAPAQAASPAGGYYANCEGGTAYSYAVSGGTQIITNPNTFATNVPGIGMRFYRFNGARSYFGQGVSGNYGGQWGYGGATFGVEVVVTGPIASGTINGALVGKFTQGSLAIVTMNVTAAVITASTCQIVADQNVNMPLVGSKELPTVGSMAGNSPFTISLTNCPAGMNKITYQLDPPAGAINATAGTFLAGSDSTATGVGFVLKDSSNAAVGLSTPLQLTAYSSSTGGTYPIRLAVQYYRTGTLGTGILKGTLTYTISYQ
ncbi:fimbrial protein [Paraburkholderia fungorum]|uniref:fimbrial protein n=1 Tax=Paraburkholderia fungorum TaxID=134537 RepID=UPI0038B7B558